MHIRSRAAYLIFLLNIDNVYRIPKYKIRGPLSSLHCGCIINVGSQIETITSWWNTVNTIYIYMQVR